MDELLIELLSMRSKDIRSASGTRCVCAQALAGVGFDAQQGHSFVPHRARTAYACRRLPALV